MNPKYHRAFKPKKGLGQHFLRNELIAEDIANSVKKEDAEMLLEIGPGAGVLTKYLYPVWGDRLICAELDHVSVKFLETAEWAKGLKVLAGDFLEMELSDIAQGKKLGIIGNYPYNISTQIAFAVIEGREHVSFFGGMFQKEVGMRLCAKPGNKDYGITSVILQAYFTAEYLFNVDAFEFDPPPKVQSGVIACRNKNTEISCTYHNLKLIVKTAFNQRRKTMSNAMKAMISQGFVLPPEFAGKRAEELSVEEFIGMATVWENRK